MVGDASGRIAGMVGPLRVGSGGGPLNPSGFLGGVLWPHDEIRCNELMSFFY